MSSPEPAALDADRNAADALAWAELRHAMLLRLASLGMRVAKELAERAVNSPYHPEARHEPGRAFGAISRSVRMTLVLEAKVAVEVIAIRKGALPSLAAFAQRPESARCEANDASRARTPRDHIHEDLIDRELPDSSQAPSSATAGAQCSALARSRPTELGPRLRGEDGEGPRLGPPDRYVSRPPPTP